MTKKKLIKRFSKINRDKMKILTTTLILIFLLIFTLLIISNFFITKTFKAEIIINQKPEIVWNYLVDKDSYQNWNEVLIPTSGDFIKNKKINYEMTYDNSKSNISSKIINIVESKELNQKGGIFGVLTFNHKYLLEEFEENKTKLIQYEVDRGFGLLFWNSDLVEPSYEKSNENLKKLIEK